MGSQETKCEQAHDLSLHCAGTVIEHEDMQSLTVNQNRRTRIQHSLIWGYETLGMQ